VKELKEPKSNYKPLLLSCLLSLAWALFNPSLTLSPSSLYTPEFCSTKPHSSSWCAFIMRSNSLIAVMLGAGAIATPIVNTSKNTPSALTAGSNSTNPRYSAALVRSPGAGSCYIGTQSTRKQSPSTETIGAVALVATSRCPSFGLIEVIPASWCNSHQLFTHIPQFTQDDRPVFLAL
jgi:hypothetical protein